MSTESESLSWFYVIVVPHNEPAFINKCDNFQAMLTFLRELYGSKVQVFPFYGVPYGISVGPTNRYLIDIGDKPKLYPLFTPGDEEELEVDPDGYLDTTSKPGPSYED